MIRLYTESPLHKTQEIFLSESQSHYVVKVMRLKEGDEVLLFNGSDGEWRARLTTISKKTTSVQLVIQTRAQIKKKDLWLCFSPIKPKRQEFLVEKATELGVSCLLPVRFERTVISKINLEKMKAHGIEASEQCERLSVPVIKPLTPLKELLENWPQDRLILFGDETLTSPSLISLDFDPQQPLAFFVGPEGGFTKQELALLKAKGKGVTLSANILRSETAALVGLSYLQMRVFS